jgi:hypothetical protein
MLYVLRFSNADCVVALADDEEGARQIAEKLLVGKLAEIVSIRALPGFAVQLSPTDDGSLQLEQGEENSLDNMLATEYPQLEAAYRRANAEPLAQTSDLKEAAIPSLHAAYERNKDITREGLRLERERLSHPQEAGPMPQKTKTARARA